MPVSKYGQYVDKDIVISNLDRICSQIFRLLPANEEGEDWVKPLETLIIELSGMCSILDNPNKLFMLVCKLEGIKEIGEGIDFMLFRRSIFEACSLVQEVKNNVYAESKE